MHSPEKHHAILSALNTRARKVLGDMPLAHKLFPQPATLTVCQTVENKIRLPDDEAQRHEEIATQKRLFAAQIALAKAAGKPLIVHIRDASDDAMALLLEHGAGEVGGVLHCYNADEQLLKMADHGFYFGIGGVLTFKNAKKLPRVLPKIPRERLVVETDAPYLTPHPYRGKRNEPAYTRFVVERMADILGEDVASVETLTTRNALRLFQPLETVVVV